MNLHFFSSSLAIFDPYLLYVRLFMNFEADRGHFYRISLIFKGSEIDTRGQAYRPTSHGR